MLFSLRYHVFNYINNNGIFAKAKKKILASNEYKIPSACFENVLKIIKKSGKLSTSHHPEIEPEDQQNLYNSLNIDTPCSFQEKCS